MSSFPILDVAIGLSFFYLLLGLICSTVNEMIAGWWKRRATFLDRGIDSLFGGDDDLKKKLLAHPLITSLAEEPAAKSAGPDSAKNTSVRPSYIPAATFATALLDVLSGEGKALTDVAAVEAGVASSKTAAVKGAMTALLDRARMEVAARQQSATKDIIGAQNAAAQLAATLEKNVASWFNDGMDRVSGWYKRNAQTWTLCLAVVVTLLLNADTIRVADILWTSPTTRAAVVQAAVARAEKPPEQALPMVNYPDPKNAKASTPTPTSPEDALTADEKKIVGELTGWAPDWKKLGAKTGGAWIAAFLSLIWGHLLGWILTAIAVSLGAPFWFDVLKKFINIRNSGPVPDEPRTKNAPAKA